MSGYTPVFNSVLDGTLYGKWPHTGIWTCLLSQVDQRGEIDMNPALLAAKIGVPVDMLLTCISDFMKPDPGSRTKEHDGRRLELIDPDTRDWGWRVINHAKYREKARLMGKNRREVEEGKNAQRMGDRRRPPETAADPLSDSDSDTYSNTDKSKNPSAPAAPLRVKVSRVAVPQDWMLDFKLAYPDRAGDQGWRKAERAANARIAEGHTPAEFIAGAKRYAAFCQSTEKTGSEFVQQAATFLGPGKPFLLPWHPPPKVEQLSPVERVLRANGVKNDERVVAEQFGSGNSGVGVLDGDVRDTPYAGFRRIGS